MSDVAGCGTCGHPAPVHGLARGGVMTTACRMWRCPCDRLAPPGPEGPLEGGEPPDGAVSFPPGTKVHPRTQSKMLGKTVTNLKCPYCGKDFRPPRSSWVIRDGQQWHPYCANMLRQGEQYR